MTMITRDSTTSTQQPARRFHVSISDLFVDNEKTGNRGVVIASLEPPFLVIKPISATIRKIDNSFVASFEEANVNASGDTREEAISNLKAYLMDLFTDLDAQQPDTLGPALKRGFEAMKLFVGKQSNA